MISELNLKKDWLVPLLILFCLVLPWSLAAMQIGAVLVLLGSIILSVWQKRPPIIWHPFYFFLGLYLITQIIAAVQSPKPMGSLNAVWNNDWFILLVPFLASLTISEKWQKFALDALLISAAIVAIYSIFQFFTGIAIFRGSRLGELGRFYRVTGGYNFYLTFAGNQLMAFGIAISFFLFEKEWKGKKTMYLIIMALLLLSIIATFGRSTWIGMFFIIMLGAWLVNRRVFIIVGISLVTIGIMASILSPEIAHRLTSIFEPAQNEGRLNIWRTAWRMFKAHPIFGIGPGVFNDLFPLYKVPGFYDATGHAHNDYLNTAVNSGIVGFIAWMAIWISWFYYTIRAFQSRLLSPTSLAITVGAVFAVSGIMVAAIFQCYYTDLENNIFWWFVAASSLLVLNRDKKRVI
jgi:putative inorganic carbon (HCO3(-)) transporter